MIPHIIHQTWKTNSVPPRFEYLRDTWLKHHPGWEYRLWSDDENRAFLATHYPGFLSVYDGYLTPICRADAIRYFLLKHFGGLYVDLDFECFQPFDDILSSESVILGLEPPSHVRDHKQLHKGLEKLVCKALMASPPQHPFWDHVINEMVIARNEPGPLDATGPFLLTRAVESYSGPAPIEVTSSEVFYPADVQDCALGRLFDLENWHKVTLGALAMRHWAGTWWRGAMEAPLLPSATVDVVLLQYGQTVAESRLHARQCASMNPSSPLISCLMVTRNRSALAISAVKSFLAQTYVARELVILDDGQDAGLETYLQALADSRIRHIRLPDESQTLGTLRNRAVALARGTYVSQWDDDDLYDPSRLAMQMTALAAMQADACFLSRWMIWWPKQKRMAVSTQRVWEGSMLCLKSMLAQYPTLRRGEDTPVAQDVINKGRVVMLDQPRLYVYVVHDANTFESSHFESHWESASQQFEGNDYARVMQELGKRLDFNAYPSSVQSSEFLTPHPSLVPIEKQTQAAPAAPPTGSKPVRVTARPSVLILTPIKNAARFLPGYFDLLARLDYPRDKLSLAFLEGDSEDETTLVLKDCISRYHHAFAAIDLYSHDFGFQLQGDRSAADVQFLRRSIIAKCRNQLFKRADRGQEKILWIDADLIDYPPDALLRLLDTEKPIVVPNCVQTSGGSTFDLNTFKYKPGAQGVAWHYLQDGIVQPPRGFGRLYLDELRGQGQVEVDGVGGTMLLVDANLHRKGILFPDYSYRGYIETEGFAMHAKDQGVSSWGLPDLEIVHAPQ